MGYGTFGCLFFCDGCSIETYSDISYYSSLICNKKVSSLVTLRGQTGVCFVFLHRHIHVEFSEVQVKDLWIGVRHCNV